MNDVLVAARHGLANAVLSYRELRRERRESDAFRAAWGAAATVTGQVTRAESNLLHVLAASLPAGSTIVEIGSFLGRSTIVLASAAKAAGATVHAVDPHTGDRTLLDDLGIDAVDTSAAFRRNLDAAGVADAVVPHITTSVEAAAAWPADRRIDLLFVDGWHSEDAVHADGVAWAGFLAPGATVVFDDATDSEVAAGLARLEREGVLLPYLGWAGKLAVYGADRPGLGGVLTRRPIGRLR